MTGKEKCSILKRIRSEVAKANEIEYKADECTFQGDCKGVCLKCDLEARALAMELQNIAEKGGQIHIPSVTIFTDVTMEKQNDRNELQVNDDTRQEFIYRMLDEDVDGYIDEEEFLQYETYSSQDGNALMVKPNNEYVDSNNFKHNVDHTLLPGGIGELYAHPFNFFDEI